jgi:putative transposase
MIAARRRRKSIRLKEYDYSLPGGYFITICTHDKQWSFGNIVDGEMQLNDIGKIVQEEWNRTVGLRANAELDAFVVMPNHIHGIIILHETDDDNVHGRGELQFAPTRFVSPKNNIGAIVRGFKGAVTKRVNVMRQTPNQPVWQRNYYEHVLRDEKDLDNVRAYIANNILAWATDTERRHEGEELLGNTIS